MDLLTDSLLLLFISSLPFKEAARTSVLSKRWRHLWRSTRNIEFNEHFFVRPEETDETKAEKRFDFIGFFQKWVENYTEPSLISFGLWFSSPTEFAADVESFIDFAVSRGVRRLTLDLSTDRPGNRPPVFDLPDKFYSLEYRRSLKSLNLDSCKLVASKFEGFVSLKEISLCRIGLGNRLISTVLENCPVLEHLCLKKCWNLAALEVISPAGSRLVKLAVEDCEFVRVAYMYIDGPKLKSFKYSGTSAYFNLENQYALEEADLDFGMELEFDVAAADDLYNLFLCLSSQKVLTVCSYVLQVLPQGNEPLGMQSPLNVQHLTLKTCLHENEFIGIKFLLSSCPLLETLTIEINPAARIFLDYEAPFADFNPRDYWKRNLIVYPCLKKNLRKVEIKGYRGSMNEKMVLNYLLALGGVIEKLDVYIAGEVDDGEGDTFRQRLGRFLEQIMSKYNKLVDISIH